MSSLSGSFFPEDERPLQITRPAQPPAKKSRYGRWDADAATQPSLESTAEDELDFYIKAGKMASDDPYDILPWWKEKASMFPLLARLARMILCIPATSASSERTFSRAGLIVTEKRTRLDPKRVNDLLVIHNYYLVSTDLLPTNACMRRYTVILKGCNSYLRLFYLSSSIRAERGTRHLTLLKLGLPNYTVAKSDAAHFSAAARQPISKRYQAWRQPSGAKAMSEAEATCPNLVKRQEAW